MNKNKSQTESRKEFIKLSIDDPKSAANYIIKKANELANAQKAHERVKIVSEILFLNHCTIYRDCSR